MTLLSRAAGRAYFALQAFAGALWWVSVPTVPAVRAATLGGLDPLALAVLDVPLFVAGSALAATDGRRLSRIAAVVTCAWTLLVGVGMAVYAMVTGAAGWGAVAMLLAATCTPAAAMLVVWGRIPSERLLMGPLAFRPAGRIAQARPLLLTLMQMLSFWLLFLVVIPLPVIALERRWQVTLPLPEPVALAVVLVGAVLFVAASCLGVVSAVTMARRGRGTPLPSAMPHRLVIAGPYRWVRNPMAVAGVAQGLGVGLMGVSWLVVVYSLAGAFVWNCLVRPLEEEDLARRFGEDFVRYRDAVRCWVPRRWAPHR